jgi:serine/threonine-protein kinase RsbW
VILREETRAPPTREGVLAVLELIDEVLARKKIPELTCSEVHLAVEEAVVNLMSYSNAKSMTVKVEVSKNAIAVAISDDGIPFDPLMVPAPDPDEPLEDRVPGGLGIFLIRESMDDVSYEYQDGMNILRMVKRLSKPNQKS